MSFIASLSTVEGLRKEIEFVDDLLDALPGLVPVFEILAPTLVVMVNSLLPIILEYVTLLEGPISGSAIEAAIFTKLAAFMVIQTFFISAISGSLIDVSISPNTKLIGPAFFCYILTCAKESKRLPCLTETRRHD